MLKRSGIWVLVFILLMTVCSSCRPAMEDSDLKDSTSAEESQTENPSNADVVPEGWNGPEIVYCRLNQKVGQEVRDDAEHAMYALGLRYLESREKEESKTIRGYRIRDIKGYSLEGAIYTQTPEYAPSEELYVPLVASAPDTWIAKFEVAACFDGTIPEGVQNGSSNQMQDSYYTWDLGDSRWVVRREKDLYAMMSYTDYCRSLKQNGTEADPFDQDVVDLASIPITEGKWGDGAICLDQPEGVYYHEQLKGWLKKDAAVYQYTAETAADSEKAVRQAAEALVKMYFDEWVSKDYEEGMKPEYKIREYKDLTIRALYNSINVQQSMYEAVLEADKNHWVVGFGAQVKGEGDLENIIAEEWADQWVEWPDSSVSHMAEMVQDGNNFWMVMRSDIVEFVSLDRLCQPYEAQ